MTSKVFSPGTVIDSPWLNDVNTKTYKDVLNVKLHGIVGDGVADDTVAIQSLINSNPGRTIYFPAGTYKVSSTISIKPAPTWGIFSPGSHIMGDGCGSTFFDSRVANGPLFDIDSDTHSSSYRANMGTVLEYFQIMSNSIQANSTGIRILNGYQITLNQLVIKGAFLDGIELLNGLYLDDGWNRVAIRQVWIDSVTRWGIKADGGPGRNEGSYTHIEHVFFQACGTAGTATPPTSGAMIWKGQVLVMESSGCANGCQQVGLYIKGQSGLGNIVDVRNWTSENTVGRGVYLSGLSTGKFRNIQIYNNDAFKGTTQFEIDGGSFTVRNIEVDGAVIRATSGNNPITCFKVSGANTDINSVRIRNITWDNFGYPGQTKFNGVQFDSIPENCLISVVGSTSVLLRPDPYAPTGNKTPYRKYSTNGGNSLGELVPLEVASTGISGSNSGLSANTRYYVYLYDNGNIPALEFSTTVPVMDTSLGLNVKTGDSSRLYKGSVLTDGSSQFITSASGWLNPSIIAGKQTGAPLYAWGDDSNRLRVKYAVLPSSDTDGTIVGTQT